MRLKDLSAVFAAMYIAVFTIGAVSCEGPKIDTEMEGSGDTESDGQLPDREPEAPDAPRDKEFVILFTNDFHSQIEPLSKDETYNADRGGIKRIKALVDSVRAAEPAVLLADAGDLVQGTYYFSLLDGVVEMTIMEELGYDIRTLGNQERKSVV